MKSLGGFILKLKRKECVKPVLEAFSDGKAKTQVQIEAVVGPILRLTSKDLQNLLPRKIPAVITNRVSWAMSYLQKKEFIVKVGTKGLYKITDSGLKALTRNVSNEWKF